METTSVSLRAFLRRVSQAVETDRVTLSDYAVAGADKLRWAPWDVRAQLRELTVQDWLRCEPSTVTRDEVVWIFTPDLWDDGYLWIRLIERDGTAVRSHVD